MPAYTPTVWQNAPSTLSSIDAVNLNNVEAGVVGANAAADDALSVANGSAVYADAKALVGVNATATTAAAPTIGKHNPYDATAGALALTLPTAVGHAGARLVVEKVDASVNVVSVTGVIRGVAATTINLSLSHETLELLSDGASWWPIAGHKTLSSIDARIAAALTTALHSVDGVIIYSGTQPLRSTCTTDTGRRVRWVSSVAPSIAPGFAIDGLDVWDVSP